MADSCASRTRFPPFVRGSRRNASAIGRKKAAQRGSFCRRPSEPRGDLRDDITADGEKRKDDDDDYDESAVIERRPLFCVAAATLSTFHLAWLCGCARLAAVCRRSLSLSPSSENGSRNAGARTTIFWDFYRGFAGENMSRQSRAALSRCRRDAKYAMRWRTLRCRVVINVVVVVSATRFFQYLISMNVFTMLKKTLRPIQFENHISETKKSRDCIICFFGRTMMHDSASTVRRLYRDNFCRSCNWHGSDKSDARYRNDVIAFTTIL